MNANRRLLLVSTSTVHGTGYLDHCAEAIRETVGGAREVLFVPYALYDREAYAAKARDRYAAMGLALRSIHDSADPARAAEDAEAIFVGGGNTFRLLDSLQRLRLIEPIRRRVAEGMPYLGASAGSNAACPTIMTTNDMPVVQPASFEALGLVSFQINPHYLDSDPKSTHIGETRETRLREYLEENDRVVVGLREGSWLSVRGDEVRLEGARGARIFRRGSEPVEAKPGALLDF